MEISERNWKDRLAPIALGVGLFLTICWAAAALASIGHIIGWWTLPAYLAELIPGKSNLHGVSAGETGDFLTGWLTPLALTWFVVTVFMQQHELKLQRIELERLRIEFAESRRAADEQTNQLKTSNEVRERQIFIEIMKDVLAFSHRNSYLIMFSLHSFVFQKFGKEFSLDEETAAIRCRSALCSLNSEELMFGELSVDQINKTIQENKSDDLRRFARGLVDMANRYEYMMAKSQEVGMDEYYDGICTYRLEGELMRLSASAVEKLPAIRRSV